MLSKRHSVIIVVLKIQSIQTVDFQVTVQVDPYVPLEVRTYSKPLGAVFYRVGNFKTSLVELPIDPTSNMIRGFDLVRIDRVKPFIDDQCWPTKVGLPVVNLETVPRHGLLDEVRDISVSLVENRFVIDWSNGCEIEFKTSYGRLTFFIGRDMLLGAAVENLKAFEAEQLGERLRSPRLITQH